ncbi:hypothetical protein BH09BAC2_BH09BAC2_15980 [soil metagenome]
MGWSNFAYFTYRLDQNIKMSWIKNKLYQFFNKQGYLIYKKDLFEQRFRLRGELQPLEQLFYQKLHKDFFFLQIGANDGVSFDPIYHLITKENVHGMALEPIPDLFVQLKKNYAKYPNVQLVNKAVHKSEKEMILYRVDPKKDYPDWTKGTASFNKFHHALSGITEADILEEKVACTSLDELIDQNKIKKIDLLQIDTEGYDYEIIKMIDFDNIAPAIISFEHGFISGIMTKEKFFEIEELLIKNKYNIIVLENDAVAYRLD